MSLTKRIIVDGALLMVKVRLFQSLGLRSAAAKAQSRNK